MSQIKKNRVVIIKALTYIVLLTDQIYIYKKKKKKTNQIYLAQNN